MISCVDEFVDMFVLVCALVDDINGCNVPEKLFGLISDCVVKFILFWGVIEFHIDVDCCKFQFIGAFMPLEFQFIGLFVKMLFDIACVGDVKNCDCVKLVSLYLYVVFLE